MATVSILYRKAVENAQERGREARALWEQASDHDSQHLAHKLLKACELDLKLTQRRLLELEGVENELAAHAARRAIDPVFAPVELTTASAMVPVRVRFASDRITGTVKMEAA